MIEFKSNTPTIAQIYQYTYSNKTVRNRFDYMERDVLKTRIKITKRTVYRKNKEGKFTSPEERLYVESFSNPQYYPYTKIKTKGAKRQRKIRHEYDCIFAIQPYGENKIYSFWNSKIVFRIGSQKKWQENVPQNKVKTIYNSTRDKLERKYSKLPTKEKQLMIKKECDKIRKRAIYLDKGDFNSRVNGLNGDFYFRDAYIMQRYSCLYGRCWYSQKYQGIEYPFFPKHAIAIINYLLRRGILKYK